MVCGFRGVHAATKRSHGNLREAGKRFLLPGRSRENRRRSLACGIPVPIAQRDAKQGRGKHGKRRTEAPEHGGSASQNGEAPAVNQPRLPVKVSPHPPESVVLDGPPGAAASGPRGKATSAPLTNLTAGGERVFHGESRLPQVDDSDHLRCRRAVNWAEHINRSECIRGKSPVKPIRLVSSLFLLPIPRLDPLRPLRTEKKARMAPASTGGLRDIPIV